jgi:ribosomal protein S18 acetylase RimI-like enzyme
VESIVTVRLLGPDDADVLKNVMDGVFDNAADMRLTDEFLRDLRHHLAVALDDETVVGMASALHYIHPDKPPELYINEVGVAESYRNRGIGRQLLRALFDHGKTLGCTEAWLGTERSNSAARRMYAAAGGEEEQEDTVIVWFTL